MEYRKLGRTGWEVSAISFGTWAIGGTWGKVNDKESMEALHRAVELGVNFFDTADVYGAGQSETYLGNTLSGRPEILIATKYGRGAGTYPDGYSYNDMRNAILRAQDRLQRDVIDLLQLHCVPNAVMQHGEIFDWLRKVKQDGLIAQFGASVETVDEAFLSAEQDDLVSLQIIYNLFRQRPLEKLFAITKEKQIGIIVRLPLASGLLAGRYTTQTAFATTDHRNYNKDGEAFNVGETFSGIPFASGLQLVEQLHQYKPAQLTMSQFALRWILDNPAVTSVIAGTTRASQVQENVSVSSQPPLSAELHHTLFDFYLSQVEQQIRGEY